MLIDMEISRGRTIFSEHRIVKMGAWGFGPECMGIVLRFGFGKNKTLPISFFSLLPNANIPHKVSRQLKQ